MLLPIRPVMGTLVWDDDHGADDVQLVDVDDMDNDMDDDMDDATHRVGVVLLEPRPTADDVTYIWNIARNAVRHFRAEQHVGITPEPGTVLEWLPWIAAGTYEALTWALGASDMAPSGESWARMPLGANGLRDDVVLSFEATEVLAQLQSAQPQSRAWYGLLGVGHAVLFARGIAEDFWWAPLPDDLRESAGRDGIGRRIR